MDENDIRHNEVRRRFDFETEEGTAILTYEREDVIATFTHTIVPEKMEGRGIGSRLVRTGLDWARAEGLKVVPRCPFVAAWIERHPDYRDLVA
jgi:predicted GNAT family acetyltransferase